jgi:peptide/nickel transport system permease protein
MVYLLREIVGGAMIRKLSLRLLTSILTLLGTSLLIFFIVHAVPADPVAAMAGPHTDAETKQRIRKEMGLDDPLWAQYLRYLGHALQGDLGRSNVTQEPVAEAIRLRLPPTAALAFGGMALWLIIGIPLGVLTAHYRDKPIDRIVLLASMVGVSLPVFWLGRMMQYELAYRAGLFPVAGFATWGHLLLPMLTLGVVGAGYYARLVHSNMIETLNQDYIRAARARGLSETRVLFKHALRNAFLPVLTVVGIDLAGLLGGVLFTESVFAIPGLGSLAWQAVLNVDVPMIMGTTLFAALAVIVANLLVDITYSFIDPRIKKGGQGT